MSDDIIGMDFLLDPEEYSQQLKAEIKDLQEQLKQKDKEIESFQKAEQRFIDEYEFLKARNEKLERVVEVHKKWFSSIKSINYINQDDSLFDDLVEAINQLNEDQRIKESE